ncbi:hypothetical protein V5799_012289 [Amblyomma americanum]|uniref:Uncharacterized protein n=1 Tax=Amblyomma americanum TaxID=6943 RepID=A0AAQ4EEF5_AMBAM
MLQEDTTLRYSTPNWDGLSATFEENLPENTYPPGLNTSAVRCSFFLPQLRSKRRNGYCNASSLRFQVKCLLFSMKRSEKSFIGEGVSRSRFGAVLVCARSACIPEHKSQLEGTASKKNSSTPASPLIAPRKSVLTVAVSTAYQARSHQLVAEVAATNTHPEPFLAASTGRSRDLDASCSRTWRWPRRFVSAP